MLCCCIGNDVVCALVLKKDLLCFKCPVNVMMLEGNIILRLAVPLLS